MKKIACLFAFGLLPLAVACGADADGPPDLRVRPDPRGDGNSLQPGATAMPPELTDVVEVEEHRLVFPSNVCDALKRYERGHVLLGDRQAEGTTGKNPTGFLRKVKSVTCGDRVIVDTDPGTLEEAFEKLKLDWGFDLPACEREDGNKTLGVSYGGTLFQYTGTAKTAAGQDVPFTASASLDAAVCLAPKYKVKADVGFLKVRSFEATATGLLDSRLLVKAAVNVDPSVDAKTLAELANKPLTKTHTQKLVERDVPVASLDLGPVRIPATLHYEATLACDFTFTAPVEAEVGARATGQMTAGLTYNEGKLRPVYADSFQFTPVPPTFKKDGMLRAICTVTPQVELKLFDLVTGEITARATGGLGASQTCAGADPQGVPQRLVSGDVGAGASATVTGKINLLGIKKWKRSCTLFDVSGALRYDRAYPNPGGAGEACLPAGSFPLPPPSTPNPEACFGDEEADGEPPIIAGTCTHDVCTAGDKLGQQCDECTMKVCAVDPYCCDTYWGISCFDNVAKLCGRTCEQQP